MKIESPSKSTIQPMLRVEGSYLNSVKFVKIHSIIQNSLLQKIEISEFSNAFVIVLRVISITPISNS